MTETKAPLQSFRRFGQMEEFTSALEDRAMPANRPSGGRIKKMTNQLKPESQTMEGKNQTAK